jgi:hypothetical protein
MSLTSPVLVLKFLLFKSGAIIHIVRLKQNARDFLNYLYNTRYIKIFGT